jgi:hypothetical protein
MSSTDWNSWFRAIRLGLWTDTEYYKQLSKGLAVGSPKPRDIAWAPFHGMQWFIAGETGYGKSNTERLLIKELIPGIEAGAVEVIGFDAQLGVELQPVWDAGLLKEFHFGKEYEDRTPEYPHGKPYEVAVADALEPHVKQMRERSIYMRKMGIREWVITPKDPGRVILFDEVGQMFRKNVAPAVRNRAIGYVDTLTMQSRKCGYVVVVCTQHANVDAIPIRHGLTFGVCHRMRSPLGYYQVTGNSMDMPHLPRRVSGLAYMSGHNKRILRTQYIPKLERVREPVVLNEARIPSFGAELERVPAYQSNVGIVDTLSGEVVDPDDQYLSEFERFKQWSELR